LDRSLPLADLVATLPIRIVKLSLVWLLRLILFHLLHHDHRILEELFCIEKMEPPDPREGLKNVFSTRGLGDQEVLHLAL